MRVIFGTAPLTIDARLPDGSTAPGLLRFEARLFAVDDPDRMWVNGTVEPETAEKWLRQVNGQDKVVIGPPPAALNAPPVEIPASVLRTVPADSQIAMEWYWVRAK